MDESRKLNSLVKQGNVDGATLRKEESAAVVTASFEGRGLSSDINSAVQRSATLDDCADMTIRTTSYNIADSDEVMLTAGEDSSSTSSQAYQYHYQSLYTTYEIPEYNIPEYESVYTTKHDTEQSSKPPSRVEEAARSSKPTLYPMTSGAGCGGGGGTSIIRDESAATRTSSAHVPGSSNDETSDTLIARMNVLCVLFSAPLAWKDKEKKQFHPIETLDFRAERQCILQLFKEVQRDIEVQFDFATTDKLRTAVTLGCRALHFSGHGHPQGLNFEDGKSGLQFVTVEKLAELCSAGGSQLEFVFVSACYSRRAGEVQSIIKLMNLSSFFLK